jgi:hypothetical protein
VRRTQDASRSQIPAPVAYGGLLYPVLPPKRRREAQ